MESIKQQLQAYWKNNWLRRTSISALTVALILLALPLMIQYGAIYLLKKQGASNAEISDINLNLFAGTFELEKLKVTTGSIQPLQIERLAIDLEMLELFSRRLIINSLLLDGLQTIVQRNKNSDIVINGLEIPVAAPAEAGTAANTDTTENPLAFGVNQLSVVNSAIRYQESEFSQHIELETLSVSGLQSWDKENSTAVKTALKIDEAPFQLDAQLKLFSPLKRFSGHTSLKELALTPYVKFYRDHINMKQGTLSLNSEFNITLGESGAGKADTSHTNPDLFAGTFRLDKFTFSTENNQPLYLERVSLDLDRLELLSRQLEINSFLVDGLQVDIQRNENGDIVINGLKIPATAPSQASTVPAKDQTQPPFGIGLNQISIQNCEINYQEPEFSQRIELETLSVSGLQSWDKENSTAVKTTLTIDKAPFQLDAQVRLFAPERQFTGKTSIKKLSLIPYQKFYQDYIDIKQGTLSVNSEFKITLSDSILADTNNEIQVDDFEADYKHINQAIQKLHWQGSTELSAQGEIALKGELELVNNRTIDKKQNYLISSFDQLNIKGLEKNLQSINFSQLELANLRLITQEEKDFIALDALNISGLKLESALSEFSIERIGLKKPHVKLDITAQKELAQTIPLLNTLQAFAAAPTTEKEQPAAAVNEENPFNISIGTIQLEQPGVMEFTDLSVSPNYHTRITLNRIEIEELSSVNNAKFLIALKQGEYTTLDLQGDGLLLDPTANLQLKATIKQLDLPPVTTYTSQTIGYGMKSGVIDADIDLKLVKREIDAMVELRVDTIEVVETNQKTAEQVSSASGMSIDLAISALKDSDNVIELKLPVKGNIDQPDFDLKLIINKAMGKAMKSASLTYLKQALQPLGSLITLYSLAKAAADHITLPPVLFADNSLKFKGDQQELLDKVIKVLKERPGLKIKACAISSVHDQNAIYNELKQVELEHLQKLAKKDEKIDPESIIVDDRLVQQKMRELADQRSAKVKAVFLEQGKLEPGRILNCLSASSTEEKSQASVELIL